MQVPDGTKTRAKPKSHLRRQFSPTHVPVLSGFEGNSTLFPHQPAKAKIPFPF